MTPDNDQPVQLIFPLPACALPGVAWARDPEEASVVHRLAAVPLIVAFMTAGLAIAGGHTRLVAWFRRGRGCRANGLVVDRRTETVTTGPPLWRPIEMTYGVVRYFDRNGQDHTVEVGDHPVGSMVPVLYSPIWPGRAFEDAPGMPLGCLVPLWIVTAGGAVLTVLAW
jgi:hypothetical protein